MALRKTLPKAKAKPKAKSKTRKPVAKTRFEKGLALRRQVLGDAYVDGARAKIDDLNRDLDKILNEWVWSDIWARPGLPLKTRSLINMALLTALNRPQELKIHLIGAFNNGCTLEEIREVLLHTSLYAGLPAVLDSFRVVREVMKDAAPKGKKKRR